MKVRWYFLTSCCSVVCYTVLCKKSELQANSSIWCEFYWERWYEEHTLSYSVIANTWRNELPSIRKMVLLNLSLNYFINFVLTNLLQQYNIIPNENFFQQYTEIYRLLYIIVLSLRNVMNIANSLQFQTYRENWKIMCYKDEWWHHMMRSNQ